MTEEKLHRSWCSDESPCNNCFSDRGECLDKPTQERDANGRFLKGVKPVGNSRKGIPNKATAIKKLLEGKMYERLDKDAMQILNKAINMAKEGDRAMIKLLMERLMPALKSSNDDVERGTGGIQIIVQSIGETKIQGEVIDNDSEIQEP